MSIVRPASKSSFGTTMWMAARRTLPRTIAATSSSKAFGSDDHATALFGNLFLVRQTISQRVLRYIWPTTDPA